MRPSSPVAWWLPMILLALPARAQHVYAPPAGTPPPAETVPAAGARPSTLRLNLGTGLYTTNFYTCYQSTTCHTDTKGLVPFVGGAEVEFAFSGSTAAIGIGVNVIVGSTSISTQPGPGYYGPWVTEPWTFVAWEPVLDFVGSFGPPTSFLQGRIRAGAGVYVGAGGNAGFTLRFGGGLSLFRDRLFGMGIDLVAEGGVFGTVFGGLQILVSPEFHF